MVVSDYDLIVIGGGFAGAAAALSFLQTAEKSGRAGRVALIEAEEPGRLKVDADGQVQSTDGEPIPGLYAAREITGLFYHKQPPETLVLRANTFGRIIGTNVTESLPETAATRG
jgi:succinate dehydrogenase/fumarate reductase flavoprotein subunit